jgi:beta-aspartyl-peptidase (threonine type)
VVVHGGVDAPATDPYRATVERAALSGGEALAGGSCLDSVERAIRTMEDDPVFNAGYGAVFNRVGEIELDALICDGVRGGVGAVAAIQHVIHPISVARQVLEASPYVLLAGAGATRFAVERGIAHEDCATELQRRAWQDALAAGSIAEAGLHPFTGQPIPALGCDTVGAVGCTPTATAAGVSTGGLFMKAPGRVGDSAVPGAGAYASAAGAAAGTGLGEAFIELLLARQVVARLEEGAHPQAAVEEAIGVLSRRSPAVGGLIAVDRFGRVGAAHNGVHLPVAAFIDGQLVPLEPTRLPRC